MRILIETGDVEPYLSTAPNQACSGRVGLGAFLELVLNYGSFPFPSHPLRAAGNASRWASKTSGFKYLFRYGREIWGIKKGISKMLWQDIEAYVNGKTAFIEQVLLEIEKKCENPEVA
jgi:hypothetical protein